MNMRVRNGPGLLEVLNQKSIREERAEIRDQVFQKWTGVGK